MLVGMLQLAGAAVELAQAEVTVGNKRAHAVALGEGQRLLVMDCAACGIFNASLGSPACASTQAEEAIAQGRWMATFPVRSIVIQYSIGARALAQSPLCRWSMLAAKWAQAMVNACCVGSAIRIASASYLAASANRPSSARLMVSQARLKIDAGTAIPKYS